MEVKVIDVGGIHPALTSMRYSFGSKSASDELISDYLYATGAKDVIPFVIPLDDFELLKRLVLSGDSHAKSARMIQVWIEITAPRYWWSEFDTYAVSTTKMSESTVHTLKKQIMNGELTTGNFECYDDEVREQVQKWIDYITPIVKADGATSIEKIKQTLPESFLQKRMVNLNYQTLRHIYFDRRNHRLKIWHDFLDTILKQIPFKEFITIEKE